MARFNIPDDWKVNDCHNFINKFLQEGFDKYKKSQFVEASKIYLMAAKVMHEIPSLIKKEQIALKTNESIKKQRKGLATDAQLKAIAHLLVLKNADRFELCHKYGVTGMSKLSKTQADEVIHELRELV